VRVLVTAGPTREPIDAVRYLSNRSSGRLGYAIAAAAKAAGHTVTLVSGPTCIDPPRGVRLVRVGTALEMRREVLRAFRGARAVIMCAAVADWRPARAVRGKLRRDRIRRPVLRLVPNPDILAELGRRKGRRLLVGFALEAAFGARGPRTGRSDPAVASAMKKLRRKNLDWIVLNGPATLDQERATLAALARDGRVVLWKALPKGRIAKALVRLVLGR